MKKLHICPEWGVVGEAGPLLHHTSTEIEQHQSKSKAQNLIGQPIDKMKQ